MKHHLKLGGAGLALLLLVGCASVPMASLDQDATAKKFVPASTKASLYIYRNETMGAVAAMSISVNGRAVGQTGPHTYFWLTVAPGKYTIESASENVSDLTLFAEAGKNYFVWQEMKMGLFMPRSQLHQVDEATGRAAVEESKLIASKIPNRDITPLGAAKGGESAAKAAVVEPVNKK